MSNEEDVDLPVAAFSFVVEEAKLDPDENHRVVKWSDPRNSETIEGIRRKDQTVKDLAEPSADVRKKGGAD